MIKDNILKLNEDIAAVCAKAGRDPQEITLVAVTKTATVEDIKEAAAAGITDFAESRVQEAREKFARLKHIPGLRWHLVGHLQTNKIKPALEIFLLIHSVDSLRLLQEINKCASRWEKPAEVLLQVNVSGEKTKFGVSPEGVDEILKEAAGLEAVRVKGLMTIAPLTNDEKAIRAAFSGLRRLKERVERSISAPNIVMQHLSMGMTNDYRIAIEEGSNMLRIGRGIFGK
ncbi:MAG: YggS family pyridoxal phosphate-dependent enzyme [Candidatus Omnitrophota bacterium]